MTEVYKGTRWSTYSWLRNELTKTYGDIYTNLGRHNLNLFGKKVGLGQKTFERFMMVFITAPMFSTFQKICRGLGYTIVYHKTGNIFVISSGQEKNLDEEKDENTNPKKEEKKVEQPFKRSFRYSNNLCDKVRNIFKTSTLDIPDVYRKTKGINEDTIRNFYYDKKEFYRLNTVQQIATALGYYVYKEKGSYILSNSPMDEKVKKEVEKNVPFNNNQSLMVRLDFAIKKMKSSIEEVEEIRKVIGG